MPVYTLNRRWINDVQGSLDEFKDVAKHLETWGVNITAINATADKFTFTTDIVIRALELGHLKIVRDS